MKRLLVGRPIPTDEQEHQLLPKSIALATFSSDAISSTAYATEEILFVTAVGGSSLALGLDHLVPISIVVAILLAIVVTSYRQTIYAYPSGGGSYIVSRENLGEYPSLIAGASLLVDYILTVAVSISAGVAAIVSLPQFQSLVHQRVLLGLVLIGVITVANLRGVKESGRVFAVPTYIYIVSIVLLVGYGLFRSFFGHIKPVPFDPHKSIATAVTGGSLGLFLLLKGFSSGAVALTGVEAISNGVPAFRRPKSHHAATTILWMGVILAVLIVAFGGLTNALIPLYAVGVFTAFTLSQAGMVMHHRRLQEQGWRRNMVVNGVGAVATFIVLLIVAGTKFTSGAWLPIVVVPLIIALFSGIKRHYDRVSNSLEIEPAAVRHEHINHTVVVLVGRIHRGVLKALDYARSLRPQHLIAVYVCFDDDDREAIEAQWRAFGLTVPLEIVYSPYRELVGPIERYIDELDERWDNDTVTVVIPEFVVSRWYEHLLHNQSALILKGKLLFREGIVVTSVPYHVPAGHARERGPQQPPHFDGELPSPPLPVDPPVGTPPPA